MDLRAHFSRFIAAAPGRIHLAAHSHHYWPDVTFEAQMRCWQDAARLADGKWGNVFGEIVPQAQGHIARLLNLPAPETIAFAPNTHEFVRRLLSCFPPDRRLRVLTSDGEFHSFARQMRRLEEDGMVQVDRIAWQPFASFPERFADAANAGGHDLVFVSQVAFDSGAGIADLDGLVAAVPHEAVVVIDGYHGFLACPTDLSAIASRAFYMAGGYKYAMAGEGACFLHVPPDICPRPRDTGWFASFASLEAGEARLAYGADGSRFLGATFDPSGLYRMVAVFDWLADLGIGAAEIHAHVLDLQGALVGELDRRGVGALAADKLLVPLDAPGRGNFLTYATPDAAAMHQRLHEAGIVTDLRGDRLRLGLGLYHAEAEMPDVAARIAVALGQS
ncbi:MAG: aminotransferase class V-fold PLP-dependent enzyme [Hyphomicrobiales bacterium]